MRSSLDTPRTRDRRFVLFALVTLVACQASPVGAQSVCGPFQKYNFSSTAPYPSGLISADNQGNVYGTAGGTIWKYSPTGGLSTLASFSSSTPTNLSGVVRDSQGNLWGTNAWGGMNCGANSNGCGFIYELTAGGALNIVHQFSGPDGATPGPLVFDSQGNLWGLTNLGGTPFNASQSEYGNGTIFKYTPSTGTFTNPLLFPAGGTSVAPSGRVTFDNNGNLYGAASGPGDGSLFKFSSGGVLTTLFSFSGSNGSGPNGYLAFDGKSNLYGTTYEGGGGSGGSSFGYGSIFQYSLQSGTLTTLYAFNGNATTGELPVGGPTLDAAGNLYGTALGGIVNVDDGVIWEYSSSGGLSVLVSFNGSNGIYPYATLAFDSQGNLWGTTNQGGSIGYGTLYEFTPNTGSGCGPSVSSLTFSPASIPNGGSTTGTITLSGPAPSGGSVVSLGGGYPYVDTPGTVTVPAGSTSATFTATTHAFTNSNTNVTITATLATSSVQGTLTETPGVPVRSISFRPSSVTGGTSTTATVTLASPAPAGGNQVFVEVSQAIGGVPSPPVQGPVTVTVPAGATSLSFPFATLCTTTQDPPLPIFAQSGGVNVSSNLTVNADSVCQSVSLTVNPTTVAAGLSSTGTVTLTIAAPSGGAVITLSSNNSSASVPSSVTVPAGSKTASFTVTTSSVTSNTVATITAALGSLQGQADVNITPALAVTTVTLNPVSVTAGSSSQGTLTLDGPAPAGGAMVSLSSEFSFASVPSSVTVAAGSNSASFTVTTTSLSGSQTSAITATLGSSVAQAFLTVTGTPVVNVSLALNPTSVTGGNSSTGTVTLSSAAPSGGSTVSLSSGNTSVATVPSSVTVPSGQTSANFTVSTSTVTTNTSVTITATLGSSSPQATLTVAPASSPTVSSVTLNPASATGGSSSQGTVTLSSTAPSGGSVVSLSSNSGSASVPSGVTVAAGHTTASFTITTTSVTTTTTAVITATLGSSSKQASLTVTPVGSVTLSSLTLNPTSVSGRNNSTATVTLSSAAPSGATVTLTSSNTQVATVPSSVAVAAGSTSATFTVSTQSVQSNTNVTISGTYGGSTRSATLTVTSGWH